VRVSNLGPRVTKNDVQELFEAIGPLGRPPRLDKGGGGASLTFARRADAVKAVATYDGVALDGSPMRVIILEPGAGGLTRTLASGIAVGGGGGGGAPPAQQWGGYPQHQQAPYPQQPQPGWGGGGGAPGWPGAPTWGGPPVGAQPHWGAAPGGGWHGYQQPGQHFRGPPVMAPPGAAGRVVQVVVPAGGGGRGLAMGGHHGPRRVVVPVGGPYQGGRGGGRGGGGGGGGGRGGGGGFAAPNVTMDDLDKEMEEYAAAAKAAAVKEGE
jgi:hypothetical protein